jgi:hypothetical protein
MTKKSSQTSKVRLEMPKTPTQQTSDLNDYKYVVTDLKRVAILAAAMFALLIALSFFIR